MKANSSEKVSIVMPCKNGMPYIEEAIESVLSQTYQNWELLIFNDGSTDESEQIIRQYAEKHQNIQLIGSSPKSRGAQYARNYAIRHANGRFVAFLDCDDLWLPLKLELQVNILNSSNHGLVFSSYQRISKSGRLLSTFLVEDGATRSYPQLLERNVIGCCTAMFDTQKVGLPEMPDIAGRQDYGLWLHITKTSKAVGITPVLAKYRVLQESLSSNKILAAYYQWKLFRKIENISILRSIFYFAKYVVFNTTKRFKERASLYLFNKPTIYHL